MILIIEQDFTIVRPHKTDLKFLKKCCVFSNLENDNLTVFGQKITLTPAVMEKVLDIFDHYSSYMISLVRYSNSRYSLFLTPAEPPIDVI